MTFQRFNINKDKLPRLNASLLKSSLKSSIILTASICLVLILFFACSEPVTTLTTSKNEISGHVEGVPHLEIFSMGLLEIPKKFTGRVQAFVSRKDIVVVEIKTIYSGGRLCGTEVWYYKKSEIKDKH